MGLESQKWLCKVRTPSFRTQAHLLPVPPDLLAAKNDLRRQMKERLHSMPADELVARTEGLLQHLTSDPLQTMPAGACIALFGGIKGEPDLLPLIPWLTGRGMIPVFFGFDEHGLVPHVVMSADGLTRGPFGVWMPSPKATPLALSDLDLVLVPGLAFDRQGGRLGRGRGYFDRLFARPEVRALRVGVGFELQLLSHVPVEAHDARMQKVVTDAGSFEIAWSAP